MRRRLGVLVALAVGALVVGALPASGITFGTLDGNQHPSTGALLADWDPDSPGPDVLCTGTLISSTVFLTAGHCTDFLESEGITQAWVTFAPAYDDDAASPSGLLPARGRPIRSTATPGRAATPTRTISPSSSSTRRVRSSRRSCRRRTSSAT
jgi:hypothetical protein